MQIYIGFITAGILIVAGMLFMNSKQVAAVVLPPAQHASVLFGGDMMFDRTIRTTVEKNGGDYIFACLDPLLKSEDLVVANLEGPITTSTSISQYSLPGDGHNYTFTFPTSTASLLYAHNVHLVNIGNNPILNFSVLGVKSTETKLIEAGVGYFGDPLEQKVVAESVLGIPLTFINYNQFWYKSTASTTIAQIHAAREKGEIPVVYTHWGEEYEPATMLEKRLAHEFVDAGAEMVIGSHPHVVQEHEIYKGKNIYYSLGNLIFDQYWEDAVDHGLMLQVEFNDKGVEVVKEIPVVLQKNRQTCQESDMHRVPLADAPKG
jgi:poly-gamma-glutamate capsule biosynthesis protein CapA/YwtB (metallophosphatase superfamily)